MAGHPPGSGSGPVRVGTDPAAGRKVSNRLARSTAELLIWARQASIEDGMAPIAAAEGPVPCALVSLLNADSSAMPLGPGGVR